MSSVIGIESSLGGWYQSFFNGTGTGVAPLSGTGTTSTTSTTATTSRYAPTPPWQQGKQPTQNQMVQAAVDGDNIVNPNAAKLDLAGNSTAYKDLFALYQGLNTLYNVAEEANDTGSSNFTQSDLSTAFQNGLAQLEQFVNQSSFGSLRLTTGVTSSSESATTSTPAQATSYQTVALNTSGDSSAVVPAFQGDVQFDVNVQTPSSDVTVPMNLADMGSTPRTMANVVSYLNSQMKAYGAVATFSVNAMTAPDETINVGGQSVTVSTGQQQWGLQLNTDPYETVTLSAPQTAPAVYIGQVTGNASSTIGANGQTVAADAESQLLKFQASGTATITPTSKAAYSSPDQLFVDNLGNAVNSIQATATAPDGSVYVLADVNDTPSGSAAAGGQDVALMKYDSAGNLLFQTDLGSASNASGLSLAVSPDGSQVAIAGQITGPLAGGQTLEDPGEPNSFVAVYDSEGDQVWAQQDDGVSGNQANDVAFGANGAVYVTGQTANGLNQPLNPQSASTGYLQAFSSTGAQISSTSFGATGINAGDGVAVDGSDVYVAGVQNGDAVVTEYDMSNPSSPTVVATRDLGNLQGGAVAGVSVQNGVVYVAGSTRSGSLDAGTITSAYSGGLDAFAATLSTGLQPSSSDAVAYYGGSGDSTVSGMTVSNGQVFITGSATGSLPGEPAIGAKDGYVAELDVATGAVDWSQRFTGEDGQAAPTSIAVAATGASVLDQLGLPQGVVDGPVSDLLTSTTSLQAGDSFEIGTSSQDLSKITISATDTMQTLAEKISQATGSSVSVNIVTTMSGDSLQIQPLDSEATVVIADGPSGSDALPALGLKAGILYQSTLVKGASQPADGKGAVYGLGLSSGLNFDSSSDISQAMSQLTAAMSVVKQAYQTLKTAATPASVLALEKAQATGGAAPAYLTAQIANYQAALTRLTAGQTSTTTIGA